MTNSPANLRKAAILLRSVDADTAATLLAQLSQAEAKALREAVRALGPVDEEERADVAAEFRRIGPLATASSPSGVELDVSAAAADHVEAPPVRPNSRPFEFLEHARVESLVPYLAREHGQTVAIVLSYLKPARAAEVLAALPPRLQADVVERLSNLGETDPASVQVLEHELADWLARQQATRSRETRRSDAVAAILAAAPNDARDHILASVAKHNRFLAERITPTPPRAMPTGEPTGAAPFSIPAPPRLEEPIQNPTPAAELPPVQVPKPRPTMPFDDLARLDPSTLAAVLRAVDANLMVLALAGASDAVVDSVAGVMPRAAANAFRGRLRQLGPTRLRDVEMAQREVAALAAETIQRRRQRSKTFTA